MRADLLAETLQQSPVEASSPNVLCGPPLSDAIPALSGAPGMAAAAATLLPTSPLDSPHALRASSVLSLSHYASASQRPKLTLNTASCPRRLLGKGGTGIRLDALSASSPTVQNTFKNSCAPSNAGPSTQTPQSVGDACASERTLLTPHPSAPSPSSSNASLSERSRSSSQVSIPEVSQPQAADKATVPYSRTPNLHPILSNTPLPAKHVCTPTTAARRRRRRPNGVAFHAALTEEIRNSRYTARHSDLLEGSPRGEKRDSSDTDDGESGDDDGALTESSESSDGADGPSAGSPKTPMAGRRKRRREWKWTLEPLAGESAEAGAAAACLTSSPRTSAVPTLSAVAPRLAAPTARRRGT